MTQDAQTHTSPFSLDTSNKPHILSELVFAPNQLPGQEDTIILPNLTQQGVINAISIGPGSRNMAEHYERDTPSQVITRQEAFLAKNGFSSLSSLFLGLAVPQGVQPKIIDVTQEMVDQASMRPLTRATIETQLRAECLFTTVAGVPLANKPADCPSLILKGITKEGETVLANAHLGRPQVNERVTEQALDHLLSYYNCDPITVIVGIAPSIGPQNYYLRLNDQRERNLIDEDYWREFITMGTLPDGDEVLHLDVLGKIISILTGYGILPTNIEAYGYDARVDTYSLASKNPPEAFSYRYSVITNQPERNGRIMVVAQLPTHPAIS